MRGTLRKAMLMLTLALWGDLAIASAPTYSADSLYNLGNSYARAGKPGLAVLNYERASLLAPEDPDIRANLDHVRTAAGLPKQSHSHFERFARSVSPTLAAWLGILGVALIGTASLAWKLTSRPRATWIAMILLGVALMGLTVSNAIVLGSQLHEAVVLINEIPARVSPVPMGNTAFVLKEAETVSMLAKHDDFVLIRTQDGRSGWVVQASIGSVLP